MALSPSRLRTISLFAGGGGLDLGLERAGIARTVCRVEHEAYAAAVLAARSRDGSLDDAPVWSDVTTFDGRRWRGVVDLIAGGFPCQDISNAGKRVGIGGERSGLWRHFARIIWEVGPRFVFVENVSALVVRGLDVVLADLHAFGFDAEWGTFRASDVGAPHRRERIFILAYSDGLGRGEMPIGIASQSGKPKPGVQFPIESARMGHAPVPGLALGIDYGGRGNNLWEKGKAHFPPGPGDTDGWRAYLGTFPRLSPALRRGADGMAHRVHRLRLLGNGVVPDQAVLAWRVLMERVSGGGR